MQTRSQTRRLASLKKKQSIGAKKDRKDNR
jgi:hypothetical protein